MPNWNDVLNELQEYHIKAAKGLDLIRRNYLTKLHKYTDRNIIAYYSGFLSKPNIVQSSIDDEDKNGFMSAIHRLNKAKGLDLLLHTPGGNLAATESIVYYLRSMFGKNIRAIVPQIAMSAGTMMACSCREIVMATHSCLGPIDPQLRDIPAVGVIKEFRRACQEIKKDSSKIPLWQSIIGQYRPTFLSQCENAIKWSKEFVESQLKSVMFDGKRNSLKLAKNVVKALTDYSGNKAHDRHIHIDECRKIGLKISLLEDDDKFQDLVLTIHHCYMHVFQNALAYKIIENHLGVALVKNITPKK